MLDRGLAAVSLSALLLAVPGCDRQLSIGNLTDSKARPTPGEAGTGSPPDAGANAGRDASAPDASLDACTRKGPLLAVGDGAGPACSGGGSSRAFRYVACSCDDLVNSASITADAYGTAKQPGALTNGSLGMNGAFYPLTATLAGSLVTAGTGGIPTQGPLTIGGDLRDQGQLDGQVDIVVNGDAEVGADVRVKSLSLGGDLTVSATSAVEVTDGNPAFSRAAVNVAAPCDCDAGPDITQLVSAARTDNDNATLGIDAAESFRSLNGPVELTLPCGRYFASELYAPNPLTLTITGRVALYVAGDFVTELGGAVRIQLAPGAELDLLIAENLSTGDLVELGSAATRGRVRVYAGGTRSLSFAGNTTIAGTLYAPRAELVTSADFEIFGALLARRVTGAGALKLHYDRSLAAGSCTTAP